MSDLEAMLVDLEAHVEHLSDHRLKLQLASGETMVLQGSTIPYWMQMECCGSAGFWREPASHPIIRKQPSPIPEMIKPNVW